MEIAGEISLGLKTEDIALVEAAWSIPAVVSSYGWVLALKDGRRVYVEYTLDDSRPGAPEELELVDLLPDETLPTLDDDDTGVYWYRPASPDRHCTSSHRFLRAADFARGRRLAGFSRCAR
jgi:hypothetical protein